MFVVAFAMPCHMESPDGYKSVLGHFPPWCCPTLFGSSWDWNWGVAKRMISIGLTCPNERSWGKVLQTAQAAGMGAEGDASQSFVILQELKKTVRKSNIWWFGQSFVECMEDHPSYSIRSYRNHMYQPFRPFGATPVRGLIITMLIITAD